MTGTVHPLDSVTAGPEAPSSNPDAPKFSVSGAVDMVQVHCVITLQIEVMSQIVLDGHDPELRGTVELHLGTPVCHCDSYRLSWGF